MKQSVSQSSGSTAIIPVSPTGESARHLFISHPVHQSTRTPRGQPVAGGKSVILLHRQPFCHNMNHYCTQRFWLYRRRLLGWRRQWWVLFWYRCAIQRTSLSNKRVSFWEKIADCYDKWLTQWCFVEMFYLEKIKRPDPGWKIDVWQSMCCPCFFNWDNV